MTLPEKAAKMQEESKAIVAQAIKQAGKYASFIKVLSQKKNIGTRDNPSFVEIETPYMVVVGRVIEAREEHQEAAKKIVFKPAEFMMAPDGKTQLCRIAVESEIRGTATGTIEVGTIGNVDKTNPYANAETSALGRALGFLGYGVFGCGIASYEEVSSATEVANNGKAFAAQDAGSQKPAQAGTISNVGKGAGSNAVTAISAQVKIKAKTALVGAGFTEGEAAKKINEAMTIDDINSLLQEAAAKKKANEAVSAVVEQSSGAQDTDNKTDNDQTKGTAEESSGKAEGKQSVGTSTNSEDSKPVGAKEIIGLKKKLKEKGLADEDLTKVLPGVKTRGDYLKVIAEHGIAA